MKRECLSSRFIISYTGTTRPHCNILHSHSTQKSHSTGKTTRADMLGGVIQQSEIKHCAAFEGLNINPREGKGHRAVAPWHVRQRRLSSLNTIKQTDRQQPPLLFHKLHTSFSLGYKVYKISHITLCLSYATLCTKNVLKLGITVSVLY